jgi:hypothetical protein
MTASSNNARGYLRQGANAVEPACQTYYGMQLSHPRRPGGISARASEDRDARQRSCSSLGGAAYLVPPEMNESAIDWLRRSRVAQRAV